MIFIDTSVWVASFRSAESDEARHLSALLDADEVALAVPVRVEILSGASVADQVRLRRLLSALPLFFPTVSTWQRMESWLEPASRAGQRFGVADLLIGALAVEQSARVWSLDSDFARMARLGLLEVYRPE